LNDDDIIKIRKILALRKREDLAKLLKDSRSTINESDTYGSYLFSVISTFEIYSPYNMYEKLKTLGKKDREDILDAVLEIHPPKEYSAEINEIRFFLDTENIENEITEDNENEYNKINPIEINKIPRVFLSYSSIDKTTAGEIKRNLESYGIEVFLAHEDIEPSVEWEKEIFSQLKNCDIFIPIVSSNFRNSKFTDQETGIAIGDAKLIVPVSLDMTPYGFISKLQALKCKDDIADSCKKIITILMKTSIFNDIKNALIESFINSENFAESNKKGPLLKEYEPFNEFQINKIVYGFLKNNQVSGSHFGRRYVTEIITNQSEKIYPELKTLFHKTKEHDWALFEPPYSMDVAMKDSLKTTISRKSKNDIEKINNLVAEKIDKSKNKTSEFDAILLVASELGVNFL